MNKLKMQLEEETRMLEKIIIEAKKRMKNAPDGKLRISSKGNRRDYYLVENEKGIYKCTYISVKKKDAVKELVQKEYDQRLINCATKRMKGIKRFLSMYEESSLSRLYENLHPHRKELLQESIISEQECVKQWLSCRYVKKEMYDMEKEIYTERGERVRSKSEKIIADKLYALKIPYRYECQLKLDGNITLYPDFTILKMPERKEVYLEHLGMLDDREYSENFLLKLNTYERNGLYLGVDLFITHETGRYPLNSRTLDGMLRSWFL